MRLMRLLLLIFIWHLGTAAYAQTSSSPNCGLLGRKVDFPDGGGVCVRDLPLFKHSGLISTNLSATYASQIGAVKTYAIAVTANPLVCPLAMFMAWDWSGHDAAEALPRCNERLAETVRRSGSTAGTACRCELLVESGRTSFNAKAFMDKVGMLEQQWVAGGSPLAATTQLAQAAPASQAPIPPTPTPATPARADDVAKPSEAARQAEVARQAEALRVAEAQRVAQAQRATEAERVRLAEQRAREDETRRQEKARVTQAQQQREAQEKAKQEEDQRAREQLARQEEERKDRQQLALQEAARRAEQERLAQTEADRRLQEERRRLEEERVRMARTEQERSQEQVRLAKELAELRRLLEERTRADAAARARLSVPSQYTERVALVIGNRNYLVSPLVNPVNDARAVKERLQGAGFKVLYFEDLKVAQIGDVLEQLNDSLKPGSAFVFFYAGHGTQINGENFLPAVDARMTSQFQMPTQSLELARVIKLAESRKAALNLVILDACRDNPWQGQLASRSAARGLSKIEPAEGTLVFYATRPGSVAADGSKGGHGLFTYHLLQHLNTPMTPVEQVFKRVVADVTRESAGKQVPWIEGQLIGDFAFIER